jgi:hypothetical protein
MDMRQFVIPAQAGIFDCLNYDFYDLYEYYDFFSTKNTEAHRENHTQSK